MKKIIYISAIVLVTGSLGRASEPAGCMPISQPIGFSGIRVFADSGSVEAGVLPRGLPVGQVNVISTVVGGSFTRSGTDGVLSLNITPTPGSAVPIYGNVDAGNLANIQGFVQISAQTQADIAFQVQSGRIPLGSSPTGSTPNGPTPNICVSEIALELHHSYSTIHNGRVYLYLNGTQRGYVLYF